MSEDLLHHLSFRIWQTWIPILLHMVLALAASWLYIVKKERGSCHHIHAAATCGASGVAFAVSVHLTCLLS